LRDLDVEEVMARDFIVLAPTATVMRGLEMVYHTGQDDFPVMDGDRLLGIATRQDMLDVTNRLGPDTPITEAMDADLPALPPHTKLAHAYETMMTEGYQSLPVVKDEQLIGLLSHDNISRYLLVQSNLKHGVARAHTPAPPPAIRGAPPVEAPRSPAAPPPPTSPA